MDQMNTSAMCAAISTSTAAIMIASRRHQGCRVFRAATPRATRMVETVSNAWTMMLSAPTDAPTRI